VAETNGSHINDGPQQTHAVHNVQPASESKPPKVFAGTALSVICCF